MESMEYNPTRARHAAVHVVCGTGVPDGSPVVFQVGADHRHQIMVQERKECNGDCLQWSNQLCDACSTRNMCGTLDSIASHHLIHDRTIGSSLTLPAALQLEGEYPDAAQSTWRSPDPKMTTKRPRIRDVNTCKGGTQVAS